MTVAAGVVTCWYATSRSAAGQGGAQLADARLDRQLGRQPELQRLDDVFYSQARLGDGQGDRGPRWLPGEVSARRPVPAAPAVNELRSSCSTSAVSPAWRAARPPSRAASAAPPRRHRTGRPWARQAWRHPRRWRPGGGRGHLHSGGSSANHGVSTLDMRVTTTTACRGLGNACERRMPGPVRPSRASAGRHIRFAWEEPPEWPRSSLSTRRPAAVSSGA